MRTKHSFDRSLWVAFGVTAVAVGIAACGGGGETGSGGSGGGTTTSSTSSTSSSSSSTSSSTSSSSGAMNCTEITTGTFKKADGDGTSIIYLAAPMPDQGDTAVPDDLTLQLYGPDFDPPGNGDQTGTFDLSMPDDDNYATCSRCLVLYEDDDPDNGAARVYFQSKGTMTIDASSDPLHGKLNATLTDVTLVEVDIESGTYVSTPVDGGKCLHIKSATLMVEPPPVPAGWTCDATGWNDGSCDCGCGAVDVDCADSSASVCDNNQCPTGNNPDNTDNSKCVPVPADWTCDPTYYSDGDCDCGCGVVDIDCAGSAVTDCKYNECVGGKPNATQNWLCDPVPAEWLCNPVAYDNGTCDCGCSIQDPDCASGAASECTNDSCNSPSTPVDGSNWLCSGVPAEWKCPQGYYGDTFCDCGCGAVDSDCADATAAKCEACDAPGSCGMKDCSNINATNNAVCAP